MSGIQRFDVNGLPISLCTWADLEDLPSLEQSRQVVTVAPWQYWVARRSRTYRDAARAAHVALPDGTGVVLCMRLAGIAAQRLTGREVVERMVAGALWTNQQVAIIGGEESGARRLRLQCPSWHVIQGQYPSRPRRSTVLQIAMELREQQATVVLVALGCPKQELWSRSLAEEWPATYVGVGGAIDTVTGVAQRPSEKLAHAGLEWASRLAGNPRRYFPRVIQALWVAPGLLTWACVTRVRHRREGRDS